MLRECGLTSDLANNYHDVNCITAQRPLVHTAPGEGGVHDEATDDLASRPQVKGRCFSTDRGGVIAIHRGGCAVTLQQVGVHVVDHKRAAKVSASSTLQEAV